MRIFRERVAKHETRTLSPEDELELYADFLLVDAEGNPRTAVAEHIMPAEEGVRTAQAKFYRHKGGYVIDEYRDGGDEVVFKSFVIPNPEYDPEDPDSHKWDTGMLRMKWMRHSIHERDNIKPVLGVIKSFFGEIPEDRLPH